MPRRNDIAKILVIGSGPIVIGQSARNSTTPARQAGGARRLKAEGYEVVLVNSNPASIMTDPEVADRTYIEPLTAAYLEEIIRVETEMMGADGYIAATKYGDSSPSPQTDQHAGRWGVCGAAYGGRADGVESCGVIWRTRACWRSMALS